MEFTGLRDKNGKDEWLTPPEIISALGQFDLDPCAPANRPWDMARHHYSLPLGLFEPDGLNRNWFGRKGVRESSL